MEKSPMTNNIYFDNRDKSGALYRARVRRRKGSAVIMLTGLVVMYSGFVAHAIGSMVGWL
jgi:hypothetical protein